MSFWTAEELISAEESRIARERERQPRKPALDLGYSGPSGDAFRDGMRAALQLAYKGCAWCDCVYEIEKELKRTATESEKESGRKEHP